MDEATAAEEAVEKALAEAARALYGVDPADFVATRKEWVQRLRKEGLRDAAKQVGTLRRPSVSAAAVNTMVRAQDPVVARLKDLGGRMRQAQSALDAAALGALRQERDEVLTDWVAAAREHAGGRLTTAVEAEVRDTAVAALADAAAEEVVTSGSLTRALSYSGFGEVDVADAAARTSTGVVLTSVTGGRVEAQAEREPEPEPEPDPELEPEPEVDDGPEDDDAVAALEMELDEAEKVVAAARAARKKAADEDAAAQKRGGVAAQQVEQARRILDQAQEHAELAVAERERAAAALAEAEADLARSRERRDAARAALEEAEDR